MIINLRNLMFQNTDKTKELEEAEKLCCADLEDADPNVDLLAIDHWDIIFVVVMIVILFFLPAVWHLVAKILKPS